jgi:hypothetical protein
LIVGLCLASILPAAARLADWCHCIKANLALMRL